MYINTQIVLHLLKSDAFFKATFKLQRGTALYKEIPEHHSPHLFPQQITIAKLL